MIEIESSDFSFRYRFVYDLHAKLILPFMDVERNDTVGVGWGTARPNC